MTRNTTSAAALLLAIAGAASADEATDALHAAEAASQARWNARDAAGLAVLYADDGMRLAPGTGLAAGPDAIEAAFRARFEGGHYHLALTPAETGHADGLGWIVGSVKVTALPTMDGVLTGTHHFVSVYRQQADGAWRLLFDSRNDAP